VDVIELATRHDEAFNDHDPDARSALEAPDIEVLMPGGLQLSGSDQVLQMSQAFWEAIPDGTISAETRVASGDVVVTEGTLTGTHTGTFRTPQGEIPASGNAVNTRYASVKEFRDERLVNERLYFDQLEFLQQLGAMS
jgi:steroid delta-isomerase-like uncharacterized protein